MSDRYKEPVAGFGPDELGQRLNASIADVQRRFPQNTGVAVFVFDFGDGGGLGWIANADRDDMIRALEEWISHARQVS